MKINISATTDVGCNRENNEDAFAFCPDLSDPDWRQKHTGGYLPLGSQGALLIVADGMGGANAGEVASAVAIDSISRTFSPKAIENATNDDQKICELLTTAIKDADKAVNMHMIDHPETAGMGTTIVLCWVKGDKAYTAWCGDSRCYIYNDKGLQPLTKDHSYVQELVDRGEITEEEAFTHPDNNVITRGLGEVPTLLRRSLRLLHQRDDQQGDGRQQGRYRRLCQQPAAACPRRAWRRQYLHCPRLTAQR